MDIFPLECSSPGVFHAWLRKDASLPPLSRFVEQCEGMHDGSNHAHSKSSESHRTGKIVAERCSSTTRRDRMDSTVRLRNFRLDPTGFGGGAKRLQKLDTYPEVILAPLMRGCESPHAGADSIARESERDRCASEASIAGESPRCRSRSLDRRSESPHAGADSIARESERARCAGRSLDRWPRVDERSRSSSGAKSAPWPDIYVGEANFRLRPTWCM